MTKTLGFDLSLNHSAAVELTDGIMSNFWYITDKVGISKKCMNGVHLPLPKTQDKEFKNSIRLYNNKLWLQNVLIDSKPDYVGVENYSYNSKGQTFNIGEYGGTLTLFCLENKIPFRKHDPLSIKMFATYSGKADKQQMINSLKEKHDVDFYRWGTKANQTTVEDLTDAYFISQLIWVEYQLRNGLIQLSDLHEKEIQVFNRITKTYPVNLLSRDWIGQQ